MKIVFANKKHYQLFGLRQDSGITSYSISNNGEILETQYRYFMILVKQLYSGTTIQFSKLRFYYGTNVNDCYHWGTDMITFSDVNTYVNAIKASGNIGSSGEGLVNGLLGLGSPYDEVDDNPGTYRSYGKMCYTSIFSSGTVSVGGVTCACYAADVDNAGTGKRIDMSIFNKWCWYSANDTFSGGARNMITFDLYMSNDRTTWQLMDTATSITPLGSSNYTLMYRGNVYHRYTVDAETKKKTYTTITLSI